MSDHLPESSLASILAEQTVHHQEGGWVRMTKDNLETNTITIKSKTASHVAELFSWVPLHYRSPSGCPFPINSLALSADVSPRTIHFWVLDKSPVSGPGRGPPSWNIFVEECPRLREEKVWRHLMAVRHAGYVQKAAKSPCGWYGIRKRKAEGCYISGVQGPDHLEHHKDYGLYSNSKKLLEGCEL